MGTHPILLGDEQVRRYVADGFLAFDTGLEPGFHDAVAAELAVSMNEGSALLGDNLLPRIPMLGDLLDSPAVDGAMKSLLGEDYAWAPHRFPHNSEPLAAADRSDDFDPFLNNARMGPGSISGSGWHQDGHSKAGRSRWHTFRAANLFYFPQDTPLAKGPTRLLAGSHLYANITLATPDQVVLRDIPKGTAIIADFDVGHAGTPNRTDATRYMLKFVVLRMQSPTRPTWDHHDPAWRTPNGLFTPHDLPEAWTSLWNWLRGAPRNEGVSASPDELPRLLDEMRARNPQQRLAAMYQLAAMGDTAVRPMIDALLATAGLDRHVAPTPDDMGYYGKSEDHLERKFSPRQFVPEDAAVVLGAIGAPAVEPLAALLDHEDPWMRINAAYALGEAGPAAAGSHADRIGELLDDHLAAVAQAATDALCTLPCFGSPTVARLHRVLAHDLDDGEEPAMGEPSLGGRWTRQNHLRYLASLALLARVTGSDPPDGLEQAFIAGLDDETGYTQAIACQGLERLGTRTGLKAAVRHLQTRRWDPNHIRLAEGPPRRAVRA
ncbi:MAG: phytanoyl-CoA dioxygenase family protein [Gammaproteobacteria bacterium]|nr:phytanoyl-CoA dioxygenase family protein [Gammaproteobacteria bacterium]